MYERECERVRESKTEKGSERERERGERERERGGGGELGVCFVWKCVWGLGVNNYDLKWDGQVMEMHHKNYQVMVFPATMSSIQNCHFCCHTLTTNNSIALRTMVQESTGILL